MPVSLIFVHKKLLDEKREIIVREGFKRGTV